MEKIIIPQNETDALFNKLTLQGEKRVFFKSQHQHRQKFMRSIIEK